MPKADHAVNAIFIKLGYLEVSAVGPIAIGALAVLAILVLGKHIADVYIAQPHRKK
jgi:hypothetical protein